jgi:hypothetical protein
MASSIETTSTTTTLKNNGTAYISVDTNENVTLAHPLALAQGGSGAVSVNGIVQVVNYTTGAVATGTTVMPRDNTIPQKTEGIEFLTLAITPKNASNILIITVSVFLASSASNSHVQSAIFQDSTANALAAQTARCPASAGENLAVNLAHKMVAGTTSATTFKVRIGSNVAATITLNGSLGSQFFGGVASSSITITEYSA